MTAIEATLQSKARREEQARAERGDFLAYYDEYFPRVYTYIRYRCGDGNTADDLTAVVFEKALAQFKRYSAQRGTFSAWVFTIARNEVNSHLRGQMRQASLPLEQVSEQAADTPTPEQAILAGEAQRELLAALESLDSRERDLLGLKFSARLTNRQIARLVGLSDSNVGVIIFRALQKLRRQLETHANPQGEGVDR